MAERLGSVREQPRGVGRPKVFGGCGNVKSITEQIQHT
jgi:hypothetical protein